MLIEENNTAVFRCATSAGTGSQLQSSERFPRFAQTNQTFRAALRSTRIWLFILGGVVAVLQSAWAQPASLYTERIGSVGSDGAIIYSTPVEDWNVYGWTHVVGAGTWYSGIFGSGDSNVLFYNNKNGTSKLGRVLHTGSYSVVSSFAGWHTEVLAKTGWTHIVEVRNGWLLFYSSTSGLMGTVQIDLSGNIAKSRLLSYFAPGWTHVASGGDGKLVFYRSGTGNGLTGAVDTDGNFTVLRNYTTFSAGWNLIAGARNGAILFYEASTGSGVTVAIDASGTIQQLKSYPRSFGQWTHITSPGYGILLYYNSHDGRVAAGPLDVLGNASTYAKSYSVTNLDFKQLAGLGNRATMFYQSLVLGTTPEIP
jgi:hypothetical protein